MGLLFNDIYLSVLLYLSLFCNNRIWGPLSDVSQWHRCIHSLFLFKSWSFSHYLLFFFNSCFYFSVYFHACVYSLFTLLRIMHLHIFMWTLMYIKHQTCFILCSIDWWDFPFPERDRAFNNVCIYFWQTLPEKFPKHKNSILV